MSHEANIVAAIQAMLDEEHDGWQVSQYVLALGLARMNSDSQMESIAYVWSPAEQPDWATDGLLQSAVSIRYYDCEDDE